MFLGIEDIIEITWNLYVKTPEALAELFKRFEKSHKVKDLALKKESPQPGSWYASAHQPGQESYTIIEAWNIPRIGPSPTTHEAIIHSAGMVSDCGFYYQDGRPAFSDTHLERMRKFVEHFTTLDLSKWDAMILRADRSGPGMIKAIAKFCHPKAEVRNLPNIGNTLFGFSKAFINGKELEEDEMAAMANGLKDRGINRDFTEVIRRAGGKI